MATRKDDGQSNPQDFLGGITLNRSGPLRDQIYLAVRRAIVNGKLLPGAPINEFEIAAALGVSRTPVREAVKKVSDEGLIDVRAQAGTFVGEIERREVEEAYIIRFALESVSVRRAAPLVTPRHIQDLEDILRAHETALRRERYDEAIARDDDFHRFIAGIADLPMLWKVVDTCKAAMDRCRMLTIPKPGYGQETIRQHKAIVKALSAGDVEISVSAMTAHLETSLHNSIGFLEGYEAHRERLHLLDGA